MKLEELKKLATEFLAKAFRGEHLDNHTICAAVDILRIIEPSN